MVLVTKTILLWLVGFLGLQGQAQHLNLIHESQGNQTLVLEINATIRELMNASHGESALQNTNETRRLNRYGEKVKLTLKQENLVKKLHFEGSKNSR